MASYAPRIVMLAALSALTGCDRSEGAKDTAKDVATAPEKPVEKPVATVVDAAPAIAVAVEVPQVRIRAAGDTTIRVSWQTPSGTAVNDDAPFRVRWNRSDGLAEAPSDVRSTGSAVKDGFTVKVAPMAGAPNATLGGEINIVVCDSVTHSICVPVRRTVELGFVVAKDATAEASVSIPLPSAK